MKRALKVLFIVLIAVVVLAGGFAIYTIETSYRASEEALEALEGSDYVSVENDKYISFSPKDNARSIGFVYYPGGKVEPEAYAPYALALAEKGIPTYIAKMPINLAILSMNAADQIISENSESIDHWIIGGHSLGGAVASKYASDNDQVIDGLVLLGAYPMESADFSSSDINVIMVNGTNDSVVNRANLDEASGLLPSHAVKVELKGGNHSQFGYYGFQDGDGKADMSYEDQLDAVVNAVEGWLNSYIK